MGYAQFLFVSDPLWGFSFLYLGYEVRFIFNQEFWICKFCLKYINWTVCTQQCSTLNRPIWPQNLMGLRLHLLLWKYQLSSINDEFITIEAFQIMDAKGGFHFLSLLYPVWLANTPVSSYPTRRPTYSMGLRLGVNSSTLAVYLLRTLVSWLFYKKRNVATDNDLAHFYEDSK